jgi:hypothetical protein
VFDYPTVHEIAVFVKELIAAQNPPEDDNHDATERPSFNFIATQLPGASDRHVKQSGINSPHVIFSKKLPQRAEHCAQAFPPVSNNFIIDSHLFVVSPEPERKKKEWIPSMAQLKCSMPAHPEPEYYPHGGFSSTHRGIGPTVSSLPPNLCVLFSQLSQRSCCMEIVYVSRQTPLTMSSTQYTFPRCILSSHKGGLCEPVRACMFSIVVSIASSCLDANVP